MKKLRRIFLAGLVIMLPALVTIYVLGATFGWIDSILGNLLRDYLGIAIPGLGFLITMAAIFAVGLVAGNVLGHRLLRLVEAAFANIPLVRPVYTSVRQIITAFSGQRRNVFESVAMIEYPRKGIYAIGFVTGRGAGEVQEKTSREVVTFFLPTTPNPTSGFLLLIPREELTPLDMTVEEAMKLIISAGVVIPEWPRPVQAAKNNGTEANPA
jgi:uncharacterized membrane protein